ncbi:MAG TPA: DUF58 domain-containing protein [Candidatus Eremiobacteraeota bacterium]|nr:DUF58 domain-containing protein [Candidatus Eremiobacteraeota bacterium]
MTVFFFIITLNIQSAFLYLLISLLLSILLINIIYPYVTLGGIEIKRISISRCYEGEVFSVSLLVKNISKYRKYLFNIEDTVPLPEKKKREIFFVSVLNPLEELEFTYKAPGIKRGIYTFPPIRISSRAPFGIFQASRIGRESGENRLVIYPGIYNIRNAFFMGEGRSEMAYETTDVKSGHSMEFLGVREFNPGDSLRFIHWPSTVKHRKLIVKEFSYEASPPVTILIDSNNKVQKGVGKEGTFEYSLRFAATLLVYLNKEKNNFNLLVSHKQENLSSSIVFEEILLSMAGFNTEGNSPIGDIIEKIIPNLSYGSDLIIFTPDISFREYDFKSLLSRVASIRVLFLHSSENISLKSHNMRMFTYSEGDNPERVLIKLFAR